eukprot:SAG22_NODE_575_length_8991_cov_12.134859_3_plen_339_part_00
MHTCTYMYCMRAARLDIAAGAGLTSGRAGDAMRRGAGRRRAAPAGVYYEQVPGGPLSAEVGIDDFFELCQSGAVHEDTMCWAQGMSWDAGGRPTLLPLIECPFYGYLLRDFASGGSGRGHGPESGADAGSAPGADAYGGGGQKQEAEEAAGGQFRQPAAAEADRTGGSSTGGGGHGSDGSEPGPAPPSTARWHYSLGRGGEETPEGGGDEPEMSDEVSSSELLALVAAGQVQAATEVWTEEVGECVPLGEWLLFWAEEEGEEPPPAAAVELLELLVGTWSRTAARDLCPFACHLKAFLFASWTTQTSRRRHSCSDWAGVASRPGPQRSKGSWRSCGRR